MVFSQLRIGTRDSKLALVQTRWVRDILLLQYPDLAIEIIEIKTQGDKILDIALSKIGDKALFTKELENELLLGTIDLAVHSMKDLPTQLPKGLEICVTSTREDIRDVVCFSGYSGVVSLKQAKTIGTSSLRRIAQLQNKYPQINFVDIRGNLQTRFKKLNNPANGFDGIVLAAAGLNRLGMQDSIGEYLNPLEILPAVGQGALAIEIKSGRDDLTEFLRKSLNSPVDEAIVKAERAFLRRLEGGCQVPIGVYSTLRGFGENALIEIVGIVASLDGSQIIRLEHSGSVTQPERLGQELAEQFLATEAKEILAGLRT
ncbi:MAG: hydroxymethylbilane synthase [Cyanobacteria bacterium]|nr:hydroxymethylbilane synthase [Cyanobacteriota bacterium]MDA1019983.1 hydroxymethylbilane synthase [Cyanobacteriota bacterium]